MVAHNEREPSLSNDTVIESLAHENLGLHNPSNLLSALQTIGEANKVASWNISSSSPLQTAQTTAYFLGQEIACNVWQSSRNRNPAMPFVGVDRLSLPTGAPQDVLLVGCAGIESYRLEQKALKQQGVDIKSHTTIDISPLPLKRIKKVIPEASNDKQQLILADATAMPFDDDTFDMTLTDLMLGSTDPETENNILDEIARVTKKNGSFVMRASVLTDQQSQKLGELMDYIGVFWNMWANKNYGKDEMTGRDKYLRLLPAQWKELGKYYSDFIKQNYFGSFRFKSIDEVRSLIESTGAFKVEEVIAEPIKGLYGPPSYYAIRSTKVE